MEEEEIMQKSLEESLEESSEEELEEELEESSEESIQESSNESLEIDYDRLESIVSETKDSFNQSLETIGLLSMFGFVILIILGVILAKEV